MSTIQPHHPHTHLQYLLPSVSGSLKFIHDGVESRVGTSCPLESLGDTELVTVDLVLHSCERCRQLI